MARINTLDFEIPDTMRDSWQSIVNLLAQITDVPAALVMRVRPESIEVHSSSQSEGNYYKIGDSDVLGNGHYCEEVIKNSKELVIPDALADPKWRDNPDAKIGMISYCGLPLLWPNGETFGTICILDNKQNHFTSIFRELLASFRVSIESQLAMLFQHHKLTKLNNELRSRVENRTVDLASLSYSLNQEIDRRKAAEQQISYQKTHDQGTGFLNRAALEYELIKLIKRKDNDESVAVIHIGFTNARGIQTKHGFDVFDELLKRYRLRVGSLSDIAPLTARPCSNDLVLAFSSSDIDNELDKLCTHLVDVGHSSFTVNGHELHLHAFIGIATASNRAHAKNVLRDANHAMMICKDTGQQYAYYSASYSDSLTHHNQLESYLLQAVRNDDLTLYFQPKVCPTTHKWIGAEALLRWRHPVLGDVSNEALIHMAEQNGLIFEVGAFVLRSAIEQAKEWSEIVDNFRIAVNISAIQLKNIHFAEQVQHLLESYHLPAKYLELEVTESGLITDEVVALRTLEELHEIGVTLSLDDFGTGYASFSYLKKYPFDAIKIDKSFVQQMEHSENDKEIIRSIIHIAKKLDLQVVIEGIESAAQESFLIDEGCDVGQGFLYGRPMPCKEFEQSLLNQNVLGQGTYTFHS